MKIKSLILVISVSIFLLLTECVTASYYIDMLKDLDVKLLCILSYITLPLVAILLVVGGYLLISGTSPERRDSGKGLIINAIIGLILVVLLIMVSIHIGDMKDLYWSVCWGV